LIKNKKKVEKIAEFEPATSSTPIARLVGSTMFIARSFYELLD